MEIKPYTKPSRISPQRLCSIPDILKRLTMTESHQTWWRFHADLRPFVEEMSLGNEIRYRPNELFFSIEKYARAGIYWSIDNNAIDLDYTIERATNVLNTNKIRCKYYEYYNSKSDEWGELYKNSPEITSIKKFQSFLAIIKILTITDGEWMTRNE